MPVHGATHHHVVAGQLVKQDMLVEGPENDKESPVVKARMLETTARSELRVLSQQPASGFHGGDATLRHFPTGMDHVLLELPLHVRDEIGGLARASGGGGFQA